MGTQVLPKLDGSPKMKLETLGVEDMADTPSQAPLPGNEQIRGTAQHHGQPPKNLRFLETCAVV